MEAEEKLCSHPSDGSYSQTELSFHHRLSLWPGPAGTTYWTISTLPLPRILSVPVQQLHLAFASLPSHDAAGCLTHIPCQTCSFLATQGGCPSNTISAAG